MQIQPRIGFSAQPAFSPRQLPDLWGWFDADNVTLDGNGRVEIWELLAGSGSKITQSDSAKRPNFGTVDGKDTIQFNPNAVSDTQHALPSAGPVGATGQTVTFVGQIVSGNGSFYKWATGAQIKANKSEPDWRWANDESASEISLLRSGPRFNGNKADVSSQGSKPHGLFIREDGRKMYFCDNGNNSVFQYTLSTPWDMSSASYDGKSKDVAANASDPRGISLKPDGTKMHVLGRDPIQVVEYTLSTPWDVSTASFSASLDVSSEEGTPQDMFTRPDGTKVYVGGSDTSSVYQYSMSTPWDLSTASFDNKSLNVGSELSSPSGMASGKNGQKLYILDVGVDKVFQYTLSTAWDISSGSFDNVSFDVGDEDTGHLCIFFKEDGSKFYAGGVVNDNIFEYQLINPWDLSSGNFDALSLVYVDDTKAKVYINGQFVLDFDPADSNIQGNTPDFIADSGEADFNLRAFTVHEAVLSAGQISQLHAYFLSRWL